MNVTFDTNCIIALEKGEPTASALRGIVRHAADQGLDLRVVAISASERRATLDTFKRKLSKAGLDLESVDILPAPAIWNEVYWGCALWMDKERSAELKQVHGILFPNHPFKASGANGDRHEKWRNRMVDTCALWTHLHHGGGFFVTSDSNFRKKQADLQEQLGGDVNILTPQEASARWGHHRTGSGG